MLFPFISFVPHPLGYSHMQQQELEDQLNWHLYYYHLYWQIAVPLSYNKLIQFFLSRQVP